MAPGTQDNTGAKHVCVIGAGPAGYACAFRAADLGMKVTLIDERGQLGGVCLHDGCIPSKTLLNAARVKREAEEAAGFGLHFSGASWDIDALRQFKERVIGTLAGGLKALARNRRIEFIEGRAALNSDGAVVIRTGDRGETRNFDSVVLAVGSAARVPPGFTLGKRIWDSSAALKVPFLPDSLLVVGGGYIGIELGLIYAGLGSRVWLVEMMAEILPGLEPDLVRVVKSQLGRRFEKIMTGAQAEPVDESPEGVTVIIRSQGLEQKLHVGAVLLASGREPQTSRVAGELSGLKITADGFAVVDETYRTTVPSIYAIGDVAGGPMLAHKAASEGYGVAEVLAGRKPVGARVIPSVLFSDPEVAWCGISAEEARANGMDVASVSFRWGALGRALAEGRGIGLTKVVYESGSGRVLGVGIVGAHAAEFIAEAVLAVERGITVEQLAYTVHAHPTYAESLQEAAREAAGIPIHTIHRPKRG